MVGNTRMLSRLGFRGSCLIPQVLITPSTPKAQNRWGSIAPLMGPPPRRRLSQDSAPCSNRATAAAEAAAAAGDDARVSMPAGVGAPEALRTPPSVHTRHRIVAPTRAQSRGDSFEVWSLRFWGFEVQGLGLGV
jgi:hypothetical protein